MKLANDKSKNCVETTVDEEAAMTEAVVNFVVSVPVHLVNGRHLVPTDGLAVDRNCVNGMELRVDTGTCKLLAGPTADGSSPVGMNLTSSLITNEVAALSPVSSTLPPQDSCLSLLLLGEVAGEQMPATTVMS